MGGLKRSNRACVGSYKVSMCIYLVSSHWITCGMIVFQHVYPSTLQFAAVPTKHKRMCTFYWLTKPRNPKTIPMSVVTQGYLVKNWLYFQQGGSKTNSVRVFSKVLSNTFDRFSSCGKWVLTLKIKDSNILRHLFVKSSIITILSNIEAIRFTK